MSREQQECFQLNVQQQSGKVEPLSMGDIQNRHGNLRICVCGWYAGVVSDVLSEISGLAFNGVSSLLKKPNKLFVCLVCGENISTSGSRAYQAKLLNPVYHRGRPEH